MESKLIDNGDLEMISLTQTYYPKGKWLSRPPVIKPIIRDYSFQLLWDGKDATYRSRRVLLYGRRRRTGMAVNHASILTYEGDKSPQSQLNLADGFTKYLDNTTMDRFRNSLLMKSYKANIIFNYNFRIIKSKVTIEA
ncbi:hypothetical protein H8356DRAFT_1421712 [Neocallimastix lanati (nom. inval.)]|nr:hypothetical protein H8356DRAFT_1421712 [Neocallimastix sp. JGI-2020a]